MNNLDASFSGFRQIHKHDCYKYIGLWLGFLTICPYLDIKETGIVILRFLVLIILIDCQCLNCQRII